MQKKHEIDDDQKLDSMDGEASSSWNSQIKFEAMPHEENIALLGEVYHLVQGGASSNSQDFSNLTQTRTPVLKNTMLHIAALYGKNQVVDRVAERAPELLFSLNSNDDTALHVAAKAGHISTVKKLLEAYTIALRVRGLRQIMEHENNQGNNVLHEAMMSNNGSSIGANIFQVLESMPCDVADNQEGSFYDVALINTNKENQSVLYLAVEAGHKEIVIQILDNCNQNVTPCGISPLVAAIMNKDEGMLCAILSKKKEWMHLADRRGRFALHCAAYVGYHGGVVHLLDKCKSCCNHKDEDGFFPLHLASNEGNAEVVKELLKYCPDPTEMIDNKGRNILHIAAESGKHEVVRCILQNPACEGMINQKDMFGNTPLHLATRQCRCKTVYAFTWDDKVDLGLVNSKNETAFDIIVEIYASRRENPPLRQFLTWVALKSAGAKPCSRKVLIPIEFSTESKKPEEAKSEQSKASEEEEAKNEQSKAAEEAKSEQSKAGTGTDPLKDTIDTLLVVSTLIVTASVAACLAVPGEADGAAKNLNHAMFQFFIFSITTSFFSSISATILIFSSRVGILELAALSFNAVFPLLGVSLISLSLAFVAGVYTVISKLSWLASSFLAITVIFVVVVVLLCISLYLPSASTSKPLRYISYYPFIFLISWAEPQPEPEK